MASHWQSQDILVAFSQCTAMRHCFTMSNSFVSGNVFTGCSGSTPLIESDFHSIFLRFSPHSWLHHLRIRHFKLNRRGSRFDPARGLVSSWKQRGNGYVIGVTCTGSLCGVGDVDVANPVVTYGGKGFDTSPIDYTEGADGKAETLEPQSLYFDQFKLRIGKYYFR